MNVRLTFCSAMAIIFLLAGCASTKVDWSSRVGNYTYDQAIAEFGPADKTVLLSDGSKTAEWYARQSSSMSVGVGTGISSGSVGMGAGVPVGGTSAHSMRLTFDSEGILKSWTK